MVQALLETVAVIGLEAARQEAFSDFLRREGFTVIFCKDADEAQAVLGGEPPDLIVTRISVADAADEQLLEARTPVSIGRMAGEIAHDFNNLLSVINGYSALALGRAPTGDPLRPALEEIGKAGERAAGLAQQLLALSGKQAPQSAPLAAQVAGRGGKVAGEAARILVVDDEEPVRRCLRAVLEEGGYSVAEAADGLQAIEELQRATPDLVITDLVMPGQEGIETIQALRRDHPSIGIIAISGAGEGRYLPMARLLGADATLPKPANPERVLAEVERILGKRR
jgi:CheY-like chemotaxis protein